MDKLKFLKSTDLFADLPDGILLEILQDLTEVTQREGSIVIPAGAGGDALYLVVSGVLGVDVSGYRVARRGAGDCVGVFALMDEPLSRAAIVVESDVKLLKWDLEDFRLTMSENPQIAVGMFKVLLGKLRHESDAGSRARQELQIAREMQLSLLPQEAPDLPGFDLGGVCIPADRVGGDYFAFNFLDEAKRRLGIVMADVAGHSMRAATIAMRFNEMLWYEMKQNDSPCEILGGLHHALRGRIPPEMFVTCGVGVLDLDDRSLHLASAGNPEIYQASHGSEGVTALGLTGVPLGIPLDLGGMAPYSAAKIRLNPGDRVVLTSDGIEEAMNSEEQFYGAERLKDVIRECAANESSASKSCDAITADVADFLGNTPQGDDITCLVLNTK